MKLSIVIGSYELRHQIRKTIVSIMEAIERASMKDVEVVIADNSKENSVQDEIGEAREGIRVVECGMHDMSIHAAINKVAADTEGEYLCIMIDGARIWSPGILSKWKHLMSTNTVVHVPNYQLGKSHQMYREKSGYSQETEESLLEAIGWPNLKTKQLIENSWCEEHAGCGPKIFESNCLFVSRSLWKAVGGFDTAFRRKDGGFASADLLNRLNAEGGKLKIISTEGTFHQLHDGSTTTNPDKTRRALKEMTIEYKEIRGTRIRRVREANS